MKAFLGQTVTIVCFLALCSALVWILSFQNGQHSDFDDDVLNKLESMLISGEMIQYLNFSEMKEFNHRKLFQPIGPKRLQSQNSSNIVLRPCNELIFTFTSFEVSALLKQYLVNGLSDDFPLRKQMDAYVDRNFNSGFKAYKICSSCGEYRDEYGGVGADSLNPFDSYCGEGKHGANANVSGLLLIPVTDDGEFVKDNSNLALWHRWVEFHSKECPSEQFHNDTFWGTTFDDIEEKGFAVTGFLTAGIGVVTLLPDFLGFGESYTSAKTPFSKHGYQVGSIPLVLKTKDFLKEVTGGKTTFSNYVISSGYSEGGMASLASGVALHDLGFRVKTQTGGGAIDHTSVNGVLKFFSSLFTPPADFTHLSGYLGWAASLSSTNLDLPNTDQGQDFLRDDWRDEVVGWFTGTEDDFSYNDAKNKIESLTKDQNYSDFFNPDIIEMIINATDSKTDIKEVCDLAIEGKTDKFCEAIALNDMKEQLANIKHPTSLCWSENDLPFPAEAHLPPFLKRFLNKNIRTLIIPSFEGINDLLNIFSEKTDGHVITGGFCTIIWGLVFHKQIY